MNVGGEMKVRCSNPKCRKVYKYGAKNCPHCGSKSYYLTVVPDNKQENNI